MNELKVFLFKNLISRIKNCAAPSLPFSPNFQFKIKFKDKKHRICLHGQCIDCRDDLSLRFALSFKCQGTFRLLANNYQSFLFDLTKWVCASPVQTVWFRCIHTENKNNENSAHEENESTVWYYIFLAFSYNLHHTNIWCERVDIYQLIWRIKCQIICCSFVSLHECTKRYNRMHW